MTDAAALPGDPALPGDAALTEADLLRWSESLAGIARTGLGFTDNQYERERFEEVLSVAAEIHASATRRHDPADVIDEWLRSVGEGVSGYVTPKVAIGAVVGNDDGEILLIKRSDSGIWLYPTGWADIGYSPAEVAVKEVLEETGIECEVRRLIGVFDGFRLGFTRNPLYSVVFHCQATGGELKPHPLETLGAGFFAQDALPDGTSGADRWGELAFRAIRGEEIDVHFYAVRPDVWQRRTD